jgi:hypothetical protein
MLHARPPAAELLLLPVPPAAEWDQELVILPLPNHHFNLKSPNRCGNGKLLSVSEKAVTCRLSSVGAQELEVFVCDDQNTFCKREIVTVDVRWPTTFSGLWALLWQLLGNFLKSFF